MGITICREEEKHYRAVEELVREAFWNLYVPGCDEHYLAHILRNHPDFMPEYDFIAKTAGKITGSIMYTRSWVEDETGRRKDTLTFGPLCVLPEFQGQGIGSALVKHTVDMARRDGYPAIIILGHPRNYCRHGFKNCRDYQVSDSSGRYPFGQLVLELIPGTFAGHQWKFHYSPVYQIDQAAVLEFDLKFPPKIQEYKPSQEEFSIAVRAYLD